MFSCFFALWTRYVRLAGQGQMHYINQVFLLLGLQKGNYYGEIAETA